MDELLETLLIVRDVKQGGRRTSSVTIVSTSGTQREELTKGMVSFVEYMLKTRVREALIDKVVDRIVEIVGRFGCKNAIDFLATNQNEMQKAMQVK